MQYYAVMKEAPEGGFTVTFPGVPGAITQGETAADAREMAADCLRTLFLGRIAAGLDIPGPSSKPKSRGAFPVSLATVDAAKVEFYRAFRASGKGKHEVAAALGVPVDRVERLFRLDRPSRMGDIEAACRALGKTLVVARRGGLVERVLA